MKHQRTVISLVPLLMVACVLVGYVGYPLAVTIADTFSVDGIFSVQRYADLLAVSNVSTWEGIGNSVVISLLSVLGAGVVGLFLALVLTQVQFRFRSILSRLAILPIALPPLVGVIAFMFVYGESGFVPRGLQALLGSGFLPFSLDGKAAILVVHIYSFHVYTYLFTSVALRQLDASLIEAALSLGSGMWRVLRRVVLPEVRPALAAAALLTFMASMASFSAPFLFGGAHRFMTTDIYAMKLNGDLDLAAAESVVLMAVSVMFFVGLHLLGFPSGVKGRSKGAPRTKPLQFHPVVRRILLCVTAVVLLAELLPLMTIVVVSFVEEGSWTWQLLPKSYTASNYLKLFSDPHAFTPVWNSLAMSFITLLASVAIGVVIAYTMTKGRLSGRRGMMDLFTSLPFAVPGTVVAISLIVAFNTPSHITGNDVLVGTFWIVPLAYFIRSYPLVTRSTAASLDRLDNSYLEAAETFGASTLTRFRKVALPLILPGIVAGGLLTLIASIGEFVSSILLYTYSSRPVSVEILSQLRSYNFGPAAVYSVLLLVLILMFTAIAGVISRRSGGGELQF